MAAAGSGDQASSLDNAAGLARCGRAELKERWLATEGELTVEKEQIENGIRNSTGAGRERWKYRPAVWQEKVRTTKQEELAAEAAVK